MPTAQVCSISATYPWFGDGEPWVWMTHQLEAAKDSGWIAHFEVERALPPLSDIDDLMNIDFTVHMSLPPEHPRLNQRRYALDILNEIVGDTDVEIRSIEPLFTVTEPA